MTMQRTSGGSAIATHSHIVKVPCQNCLESIPNTRVTNEIGRKMKIRRLVALLNPVTSTAARLERFVSSTKTLLIIVIVDLPASHSEIAFWIRVER